MRMHVWILSMCMPMWIPASFQSSFASGGVASPSLMGITHLYVYTCTYMHMYMYIYMYMHMHMHMHMYMYMYM